MTDAGTGGSAPQNNTALAERISDRELVVTRTINGPAHLVFEAWTRQDLFRRWWVPQSFGITLLSCDLDVRVGGGYKLVFSHPASEEPMAFHGRYLEVVRPSRIVWTNEEESGGQITTVTFEDMAGKTRLVLHELYPSKEALDEAIASGSTSGNMDETFDQLDAMVVAESGTW